MSKLKILINCVYDYNPLFFNFMRAIIITFMVAGYIYMMHMISLLLNNIFIFIFLTFLIPIFISVWLVGSAEKKLRKKDIKPFKETNVELDNLLEMIWESFENNKNIEHLYKQGTRFEIGLKYKVFIIDVYEK